MATNGNQQASSEAQIIARNWERYQYGKDRGHYEYILRARECEDMYLGAGLQWSAEDTKYLESIGRPALEDNHIFPAVNTAKGLQLQSRVDIAFRPAKEGTSEQTADTLSKIVMQICDDCQFQWHETQAFDDGMIQRRGFIEFKMDFDSNINGDVTCESINPLHVVPDPDAASYDPRTWGDVIILRFLTLDEIARLYGEAKAKEAELVHGDTYHGDLDADLEDMEGFAQEGSVATKGEATDETGVRRVLVVDRQWKQTTMQPCYIYPTGDVVTAIGMSKEQEAAAVAEGAIKSKRFLSRIRWTVTTSDVLLHDDWSPYRTYTIIPYFPYFRRGRTRGMVDNAISPQIAYNKLKSATVHIINTTANAGWIVDDGALINMTETQLADYGSQTGVVIVKHKDKKVEKIAANRLPDGHDRLMDRCEHSIKTITGISDALQGLNGNEVSGKAIVSKQYMGQTQMGGPLDNLARTRFLCAMKLLELVQDFYTARRVIMITDKSDFSQINNQPVVINDVQPDGSVLNDLTIGEYSVVVTEQPTQATFMDNQYQQAMEMREAGIQIPDSAVIEMSSITKKHEIAKAMADQAQPKSDPLNDAKVALTQAQTEKTKAETVNKNVEGMYSTTQAAREVAIVPELAPMIDQMLKSAGFEDQDMPPIVAAPDGMVDTAAMNQLAGEMPQNTNPLTPANPGVGMQAGIERPGVEQV